MRSAIRISAVVLLAAALGIATETEAISLEVAPSSSVVQIGDSLDVAIAISDLGDGSAPSVGVFDLDLGFDPAVLSVSGVTFGDPVLGDQLDLFDLGSLAIATPGVGTANLFELSFDSAAALDGLQAGSFTLATVAFDAVGLGTSSLDLGVNALGDSLGNPLRVEVSSASVSVVPEPTAFLVFLAGIGLVARRLRLPAQP